MKTNVNMIRRMGQYEILQRTSDGYFDANALLVQWNRNNDKRRIDIFLNTQKTKEFISEIEKNASDVRNCTTENQAYIIKKGRKTKLGQTKSEVWMHPYLFIDFAMWINPRFKYQVIKFVYDQLIKYRHEAGDNYRSLTAAIQRFEPTFKEYSQVAKALNYIVFDRHEKNVRQIASAKQLERLSNLEAKLAFAVDMGYINNYQELLSELRRVYLFGNL